MSQEIINTGSTPNDGGGDPLRTAFDKINNNFANLYSLTGANNEMAQLIDPTDQTSLRNSFNKINDNFANLFSLATANSNVPNLGNTDGVYLGTGTVEPPASNINIGNLYITNNTFDSRSSNPVIVRNKTVTPSLGIGDTTLNIGPYGNQEYINIGASPNDGNGDPLRVAFGKINNNFSNLFLTTSTTSTAYTNGDTQNQVIFEVPIEKFYQAQFQIRSSDAGTPDMQDITLSASLTNNRAGVKFSGYSTLFEGNAICRYDMDISDGNVRVLINPLADIGISHFIAAYITYPSEVVIPGVELALNGYANGYLLGTENNLILTTEN